MEIVGCTMLGKVTSGCRVVLLCATEIEAELLQVALLYAEQYTVAGKTVYVGEIEAEHEVAPATVPVVLAVTGCDKANVAHLLTCLLQAMDPRPALVLQMGIAGALPSPGPGPGATVGDIVVASQEMYSDTGASSPDGWLSAAEIGLPIATVHGVESGGVFHLDASLTSVVHEIVEKLQWPESVRMEAESPGHVRGADDSHQRDVHWPALASRPGRLPAVLMGPCITSSQATGRSSEAKRLGARFGALAESMEGAAAAHICALYGVPFLEIRGISNLVGDRDRESWQIKRASVVAGWAALAVVGALDSLPLRMDDTYVEL